VHFEGSFEAPVEKEKLYSFVTDPKLLVTVIPDVKESSVTGDDRFSVRASVGVGPLRGLLDMDFAVAEKVHGRSAKLIGKGRGMQSTVDLVLSLKLDDTPRGCEGRWVADVSVGGTLASVGGRLIGGVAEKYVKRITEDLSKKVGEMSPQPRPTH
jgi:carbon monoxide dehydrogenase subunit G